MNIKAGLSKKVGGVPVVYPVAAFVLVLAILAFRMKPATVTDTPADPNAADNASGGGGELYPAANVGTVVAAPAAPIDPPNVIETNADWMRKAVAFCIAHGSNPGSAQLALQRYLDGENLTYAEGNIRDMAIREYGLPPEINAVGSTAPRPTRPGVTVPKVTTPPRKPTVVVKPKTTPKVAPSPMPPKFPGNLRQGSTGPYVAMVQKRLHITADGKFGPITANAVKAFQRSHGLQADGIVGPLTWRKLFG